MRHARSGTVLVFAVVGALAARGDEPQARQFNELLAAGKTAEAQQVLAARIAASPSDDQARLAAGVVELARGVERLGQSLHRHGLRSQGGIPFFFSFRLPIGSDGGGEEITPDQLRAIIQQVLDDLARVRQLLEPIGDREVKLPLKIGLVRLDLNGDGKAEESETLWKVYASVAGQQPTAPFDPAKIEVALDTADAYWLRGYCHLLSATLEVFLAYDWQDYFERVGHLWFRQPRTPHSYLMRSEGAGDDMTGIVDWIAAIHGVSFELREPQRMKAALQHLQAMSTCSRLMWKACRAETDNDLEWIPRPGQTGVIPNVVFTEEMVAGWFEFLDELDLILAGKRLIPFWRVGESRGVNLQRVFTEPRKFDLVYWAQGTAATPYLEAGAVTRPEVWERLQQLFNGRFIAFAMWVN